MNMHFCGGELKSLSLLGKAKNCLELSKASAGTMKFCPHHKKMKGERMSCPEDNGCCSDKTIFLEPAHDQNIQKAEFETGELMNGFLFAFVSTFLADDTKADKDVIPFACYKPPLIHRDIPVLNQSFLL